MAETTNNVIPTIAIATLSWTVDGFHRKIKEAIEEILPSINPPKFVLRRQEENSRVSRSYNLHIRSTGNSHEAPVNHIYLFLSYEFGANCPKSKKIKLPNGTHKNLLRYDFEMYDHGEEFFQAIAKETLEFLKEHNIPSL